MDLRDFLRRSCLGRGKRRFDRQLFRKLQSGLFGRCFRLAFNGQIAVFGSRLCGIAGAETCSSGLALRLVAFGFLGIDDLQFVSLREWVDAFFLQGLHGLQVAGHRQPHALGFASCHTQLAYSVLRSFQRRRRPKALLVAQWRRSLQRPVLLLALMPQG